MRNQFSEDNLVQKTTINYFKEKLGWETVYAFNEVLGENGTLGRLSEKEVILVRYLKQALKSLNPGLPTGAYDAAVEEIIAQSVSKQTIQINKEKYLLLKNGVKVQVKNSEGEIEEFRLKVFNFDEPHKNHFIAVREFWIKGNIYRRRVDMIGFVNGIPLLFIELKNIHKNIKSAYDGNLSDYMDTVPHLFHYNALTILSNGTEGKMGSPFSKFEYFHDWKRLKEEDEGVVDFETMLKGVCSKENFMDLFENFILFDESSGKTVKIIARNHQFLGVNKAFDSVYDRENKNGQLGVFWHTQGSGKSYSMVFFSQKVHRKLKGNHTFVIMTDRKDLDNQIYNTFAGVGAVTSNAARAEDGVHLEALLNEDHRYVFSLMHKFNKDVEKPYSTRPDIIVISDEAHRTQYGQLALNMRRALPNASFIGFTGTPLFKKDEITKAVFGDYVSTYNFKRAVDDGATVPLYYESRGEKLKVVRADITEKVAAKIEELGLEPEQEERIHTELKKEYRVLTSESRLEKIAKDFVDHYTSIWTTGKAMFVCLDKLTAVRMYELIDKYWKEYRDRFAKDIKYAVDEQDELERKKKLTWLDETEYAVVVSDEQNEIKKFEKWGLDIQKHRKKMNERDLETEFKDDTNPFRIAIVCAMWLTGFDVKSLSTLYLDKPLKEHTLIQAIARANRVYENKNNGLIVDYVGVLKNLRKALVQYAADLELTDGQSVTQDPDVLANVSPHEDLVDELRRSVAKISVFLKSLGFDIESVLVSKGFPRNKAIKDGVNAVCASDETEEEFKILAKTMFKKFWALKFDSVIEEFVPYHNVIDTIYKELEKKKEPMDVSDALKVLHDIIQEAIEPCEQIADPEGEEYGGKFDISKIDFEKLKQEFKHAKYKNTALHVLKNQIEVKMKKMINMNPSRVDYYKRYQEIIVEYNKEKDRAIIEDTFRKLIEFIHSLSEEETRAVREGLTEEHLAVFDLLVKDELSVSSRNKVKNISRELLEKLKSEKLKADNWRIKTTTTAAVKNFILDFLFNNLPEEEYKEEDIYIKRDMLYNHIFMQYESTTINAYSNMH